MQAAETIRAWKDEAYRDTLTAEQRAQLAEHPAGIIEFQEPERIRLAMRSTTGCCHVHTAQGNCK
jgi:mersacidin/lichenicidin family type 2 lantibiotic